MGVCYKLITRLLFVHPLRRIQFGFHFDFDFDSFFDLFSRGRQKTNPKN